MKMNLAQMQVIQSTIEFCKQRYLPVFKYNGNLMTADFLPKESIDVESKHMSYRNFSFEKVHELSNEPVKRISLMTKRYAFFKSRAYVMDRGYNPYIKDKLVFFLFLEGVANNFKENPIPTSFITNVQYLDKSISPKVDFLRLDDNPEFEFISLVSKN